MIIVGLTGGIATGKSTVSNFIKNSLENKRIVIVDADKYSIEAVQNPNVYNQIKSAFPQCFHRDHNGNDVLDRRRLGELVFSNPSLKKKLESIIHPHVIKRIILRVLAAWLSFKSIVVLDVPLLFECKLDSWCNQVIVVSVSDPTIQTKRLRERNGWSEEEALARIASQIPLEEKEKKADIIISNNETREYLYEEIIAKFPKESTLHFIATSPLIILIIPSLILILIVISAIKK